MYDAGTITVWAKAITPYGCVDSIATTVIDEATLGITSENPPAICNGQSTNLTATASGCTTPAMTYTWDIGGTERTTTVPTIPTGNLTATTTYTVTVRNAYGNTSAVSNTGTITVHPAFTAGTITTASGNTPSGTQPDITIVNATPASGGDGNITYEWRRSGDSSATLTDNVAAYPVGNDASNYNVVGTYTFKRYAHDGTCNTEWEPSTGQYTLKVDIPCPPNSIGACTWSCSNSKLVWSGALRNAAGCNKVNSISQATTNASEYIDYNIDRGFYYNWTCLNKNTAALCPSPWWRVPTQADINKLTTCTAGAELSALWGLQGFIDNSTLTAETIQGRMWTTTVLSGVTPLTLVWRTSDDLAGSLPQNQYGLQVHCVRDSE
jgi:hypothetical protein